MRKRQILIYALLTAILSGAPSAWALEACTGVGAEVFNLQQGVALKGYDPVSYFTEKVPSLGKAEISTTICDVTYHFNSEAHRDLFLQNPDFYEPGFGGFNPFSMAQGAVTGVNPEVFDTSTGRLLLFINEGTKRRYLQDPALQDQALINFSELLTEGF